MQLTERKPTAFEKTKKIKTVAGMMASFNHNYRKGDTPENAENERSYLNEELIPLQSKDYAAEFKNKLKEHDIKPRKNAVLGLEVILEAQHVQGDFNLEEWKKRSAEWLKDYFGQDNVISAVYHGDESQPHIHAMVIPIVDGGLRCCEFTNGKEKLTQMQTSYAKSVEGLGLERGMERTPVSYEVMQKLRATTGKVASETLPAPNIGENVQDYYQRANEAYSESKLIAFRKQNEITVQAEKAVELVKRESEARISDATARTEKAEKRVAEIEAAVKPLLDENSELKKEIAALKFELDMQKRDFSRYLQNGLSASDLKKVTNLNKAFSAFDRNLLGPESAEKKDTVLTILGDAIDAFNEDERNKGELMDDRENGFDTQEVQPGYID